MHRTYLLIVTSITEGGTGLLLLLLPSVPLALLLGIDHAAIEAAVIARVAGGALIALSIACWYGRSDSGPSQRGILLGVLIYDVSAATILVYAGLTLNFAGI